MSIDPESEKTQDVGFGFLRLNPDYDAWPWTVAEMNLLADEAEEMIAQRESHER